MTIAKRWDDAWTGRVLTLATSPFNNEWLEGSTQFDRDLIRRATMGATIRNEKRYNELLHIVSDWGYCVETPMDFKFKE